MIIKRRANPIGKVGLEQFRERDLSGFEPFAIFLDSVHRGGRVFIVGLGINITGYQCNRIVVFEGSIL